MKEETIGKLVLGTGSAVGGFLAWFLGGFDAVLITLIVFMVIDYVTGIIKGIYTRQLSSAIGLKGIIKKMLMFCIVGLAVVLQRLIPEPIPLREITIVFFLCNEGLSVLENAGEIIPLPEKIKEVLLQLRDKNDELQDDTADKDKQSKPDIYGESYNDRHYGRFRDEDEAE